MSGPYPAERGGSHELFFMCESVVLLIEGLTAKGIACGAVEDLGWGRLTRITLPGGGEVGVYEPRHERPANPS